MRPSWRLTRFLVLILGITVIVGSVGVGAISGNLVEIANKTWNLLVCPTFGLFFLAIFVKNSTPFGALVGAAYSTTAAVLLAYWDALTGRPGISFTLDHAGVVRGQHRGGMPLQPSADPGTPGPGGGRLRRGLPGPAGRGGRLADARTVVNRCASRGNRATLVPWC